MIGFAGSRKLDTRVSGFVRRVVLTVLIKDHRIATGCAIGADQMVLQTALSTRFASQTELFAIGGPEGQDFWKHSAVHEVTQMSRTQGKIHFWAGGDGHIYKRLHRRSTMMVKTIAASARRGEKAGLVAFLAGPRSQGTLRTMQAAFEQGLTVIAFPLGFSADFLPALKYGCGEWVVAGKGLWRHGYRWVPNALPK